MSNKEEVKMEVIRLKDVTGDEAELSLLTNRTGTIRTVVTLDFDPYDYSGTSIMHYTPDDARKLAAALIMSADEAELPVGKGKTVKDGFSVADELTKNSKFL